MQDIERLLHSVANKTRQKDAVVLIDLMRRASEYDPYLCGSMIGFGQYHYKYESGHEGDSFVTGFAPRSANSVVYIMPGFSDYVTQLSKLGKHKLGKSCLYLGSLKNVDLDILEEIVKDSVKVMQERYTCMPSPITD